MAGKPFRKQAIVRKVIAGKRHCDLCRQAGVGPISEVQLSAGGGDNWMDLCETCSQDLQAGVRAWDAYGPLEDGSRSLGKRKGQTSQRSGSRQNLYGPRPKNGGFRCRTCGTEEYPLFGLETKHPVDFTFCRQCLLAYCEDRGLTIRPTRDAEPFLTERSSHNPPQLAQDATPTVERVYRLAPRKCGFCGKAHIPGLCRQEALLP